MKICLCVGTRPNFIKAAPLIRAFEKYGVEYRLVHTGQHYDYNMAGVFFKELGIPKPDNMFSSLNPALALSVDDMCKDDSTIERTSKIMREFSYDCERYKPDVVMVLGDVDSSLACALTATIMNINLAHVEAGERCGDKSMVEERNRKTIDGLSDYLFCASENSIENLINERIAMDTETHLVGNVMIDQLKHIQPLLESTNTGKPYAVLTLHRAENVDDLSRLSKIHGIISKISEKIKIVFPCHPRTKKQFEKGGFMRNRDSLAMVEPMSYLEFMKLVNSAKFVLTDSGGLQMETSYLNVPCITLRESTEWLETVSHGTNVITGIYETKILMAVNQVLREQWKHSKIKDMPLHDGRAAERIVKTLTGKE